MKRYAKGMLNRDTPVENYNKKWGLWVKREDLSCPPPGPPFSKTRGVYARVKNRPEDIIGVLDTFHSQAGHAVARACQILGKQCINFYPVYKREIVSASGEHEIREPQIQSEKLGADLHDLPAGRSCILFHQAKKLTLERNGYIMPNALKLEESVTETAKEVGRNYGQFDTVIIPASSGTIAAGVISGFHYYGYDPEFIIHLGYSRSHGEVERYLKESSGVNNPRITIVDESYAYKDKAREGLTPDWPCNAYYDLKAFRWFVESREIIFGKTLFWNIG